MSTTRKAPDGSGSIRQRADGRWEGRYTYTDPRTGKICRGSVYGKSKKETSEKLRAKTAEIDKGTFTIDSSMTLEQWVEVYIKDYLEPQSRTGDKSKGTEKSYRGILRNHILPALGKQRLRDIKAVDIQRCLSSLKNKAAPESPLSAKTITNVHGALHAILGQAVANDLIARNPADKVRLKLPKVQRKPPKCLSEANVQKFLATINGHQYELLYLFDIYTGLREGEILGLSWDCVDWANHSIQVRKQIQQMGAGEGFAFVNTKSSNLRHVAVSGEVLGILRQQQTRQEEMRDLAGGAWENPHDLIFTNEVGRYLRPNDVYKNVKRIMESIGAPDMTFHSLRHTFATLSILAGNDVKTVQSNMGHYSASFTMDVYVSALDKEKRAGADRLTQYIKRHVLEEKGSDVGSTAGEDSNDNTFSTRFVDKKQGNHEIS